MKMTLVTRAMFVIACGSIVSKKFNGKTTPLFKLAFPGDIVYIRDLSELLKLLQRGEVPSLSRQYLFMRSSNKINKKSMTKQNNIPERCFQI